MTRRAGGPLLCEPRGEPPGQQLRHGHAVEVGETRESLNGHGTVAALVRAHHHRLPAALALLFDAMQRQSLLRPNRSESNSKRTRIVSRHRAAPPKVHA